MRPEALRVGIVGAGWAARQHAESIRRLGGAVITGVVDVAPDAASALAADLGEVGARVLSLEALLDDGPDAIVVATPSGLHREAVEPALEAGIAVFVEKPLTRTVEDAKAIRAVADRTGIPCAVGYQWRALDPLLGLRARLADERIALMISQGVAVTQTRPWFADGRLSGGLLFERVSHHIDLQRMFAGEVAHVTAVRGDVALSDGDRVGGDACDDVISLTLGFVSGAVGAIHVVGAPGGYPVTQAVRVFSTADAYDVELDPLFSFHAQGRPTDDRAVEHPFLHQMRRFLDAARTGDATLVCCSAADAAGTVRVAAAAERALAERSQVSLTEHGHETRAR